ncbi:large ribosomal subunit protein uL3m [Monosporozyma servazzii]
MFKLLAKTCATRSVVTTRAYATRPVGPAAIRPQLLAPSTITKEATTPKNHITQRSPSKWLPQRTGVIGKKLGMMPYFDPTTGDRIACTVVEMNNVEVLMQRTPEINGYFALQIGYGTQRNPLKLSRQLLGHLAKVQVNPKSKICEFQFKDQNGLLTPGTLLKPSFFKQSQFIDVQAISKGKGFAGVMKRHNFKGQPASHGNSLTHRHGGSYGMHQDPGRILPGKKMPGRMGGINVTLQNLQIIKIDDENNVLWIKGAIPGSNGSYVKIQDSIKKPLIQ